MNQEPLQMESCEPPAALNVLPWPVVPPKNRVGGSPAFSFVFAFQYIGETLDTPSENGGCGYDFASGVHKYLYAEDDPVDNTDPTGHITAKELSEELLDKGTTALDAVSDALKTIWDGGTGAEALEDVLVNSGPDVVQDILDGQFYNGAVISGSRIQIEDLYPKARNGVLDPRGPIGKLLYQQNALQVDFYVDQQNVNAGIAPLEIVDDVDGDDKWIPFFVRWNQLGSTTAVSLFPITYNKTIKKFGPDLAEPFPFPNPPITWGLGFFHYSTGFSYTLDFDSVF